jgi:hypothetical protein
MTSANRTAANRNARALGEGKVVAAGDAVQLIHDERHHRNGSGAPLCSAKMSKLGKSH